MKQTSTQQNDEVKVGDELYTLYLLETTARGINYFNKLAIFPSFTGGDLDVDFIKKVLIRLAVNKSMIALMLSDNPKLALESILFDKDTDRQINYVTDFIDDITLNVRLRNKDLYDSNKAILLDQIRSTANEQTNMNAEEREVFEKNLNFFSPILLTLHYLRKIGYNNVL